MKYRLVRKATLTFEDDGQIRTITKGMEVDLSNAEIKKLGSSHQYFDPVVDEPKRPASGGVEKDPQGPQFADFTVDELKAWAEENKVVIPADVTKKADIVAYLEKVVANTAKT